MRSLSLGTSLSILLLRLSHMGSLRLATPTEEHLKLSSLQPYPDLEQVYRPLSLDSHRIFVPIDEFLTNVEELLTNCEEHP